MKKQLKRLLALILMLVMLVQTPAMAFADASDNEAAQPTEVEQQTDIPVEENTAEEPAVTETDDSSAVSACTEENENLKEPTVTENDGGNPSEKANQETVIEKSAKLAATKPTPKPHVHDYHWTGGYSATCTTDGWYKYSCSCGASFTGTLHATGHSYGDYTYTSNGHEGHTGKRSCSKCGDVNTVTEEHTYPSGSNVCSKCGYVRYPNPAEVTLSVSGYGNGTDSGTGYVTLNWNNVNEATYYFVCQFNGIDYTYTNVGNVTSWTSGTLSAVPCIAYRAAGCDAKYNNDLNYYFAVIPANEHGYSELMLESYVRSVILPDTVPPNAPESVTVEPAGYTNADEVTVSWSGLTDYDGSTLSDSLGSGRVWYSVNSTADWQDAGSNAGSGSFTLDVSALEDGSHIVYIRGTDTNGNTGAYTSGTVYIDREEPDAPQVELVQTDWTKDSSLSVSWSGLADLSGLDRVEYCFDGGEYISTGHTEEAFTGYGLDVSSLEDGEHTVRLRAVDTAGNTGEYTEFIIKKDTAAPTVSSLSVTPDDWSNADTVNISWEGLEDGFSGVEQVWYAIDGGDTAELPLDAEISHDADVSSLADGKHTVLVHFEDHALNVYEKSFEIYTDFTKPELEIVSPADGNMINGNIEVYTSVDDLSLDTWELYLEDELLADGDANHSAEHVASFNCKQFEDGQTVTLTLKAADKAGNSHETVSVLTVNKSAMPLASGIDIESPSMGQTLTSATEEGAFSLADESFLYIDGLYEGKIKDNTFTFNTVTYEENSSHTISIINESTDNSPRYSGGLAEYIALTESFDESFADSYLSESHTPKQPVMGLRFVSTGSADIAYSYSTDGSSWTEVHNGEFIPLKENPSSLQVKAEGAKDGLSGYSLYGIINLSPLTVKVKMLKETEGISSFSGTTNSAKTELFKEPEGAATLFQYIDRVKVSDNFILDALSLDEDSTHNSVVMALNSDGTLSGTNIQSEILLRENIDAPAAESGKLTAAGPLYAFRLEKLDDGNAKVSYSTDGSSWTEINDNGYVILEKAADALYFKAEGGEIKAWHIEGVSSAGNSVKADLVSEPVAVTAKDYGKYYENEKLWRYDLAWTDNTPADASADNTTGYEIYRDGQYIATVYETSYTDNDYVKNASYTVRTVRTYGGTTRASKSVGANMSVLPAPKRATGVVNVAEEQKQSEYLNSLYGGEYTLSAEANPPHDEITLTVLGEIDLCANGLEPVNFATGNFYLTADDYRVSSFGLCDYTFERTFNTMYADHDGPFGKGWESELSSHLTLYTGGGMVFHAPGGANVTFERNADGTYSGGEAYNAVLSASGNEYRVTDSSGDIRIFTSGGLLKAYRWHDGNEITFLRDEDGLLTEVCLPDGNRIEITMDKEGHVTQITTLGGSILKYGYKGGRLASYTDAAGNVTKYEYDTHGRMTKWYDANGNCQVENVYDDENRVIRQKDASGNEWEIEYLEDHTAITDTDGNVSEVWYDGNFHTTKTVDAEGNAVSYTYDEKGSITSIADGNGQTTRYEYDELGHKTKETHPDGTSASFEYNGHNLVGMTDESGAKTEFEYDSKNRLVRQINPDGGEIFWEYNEYGQVMSVTDALGGVSRNEYDGCLLKRSTDTLGNVTEYSYDAENRLILTRDAEGNETGYAYDEAGNPSKVIFADGTEYAYAYDAAGNLLTTTDALGNVTALEYDASGNLIKAIDANGNASEYVYDHNGNITSVTDSEGHTTVFAYDGAGRRISATDALGNTVTYKYDANGNVSSATDAMGNETVYAYDFRNNLISETNAEGEKTEYAYDVCGNLTEVTRPDGGKIKYVYDAMGRNTEVILPSGSTTSFTYDANSNAVKKTDALGNETLYGYDGRGNLVSVTDALGNVTEYVYDALSRTVSSKAPNGAVTSYVYDSTGNLISTTDALGGITSYTYDANGRITALTDVLGRKSIMSYDALGNVTEVMLRNGGREKAEYNALGLLTADTDPLGSTTRYEYGDTGLAEKITDALEQSAEMQYDANGNVIAITYPDGGTETFEYDRANRLVKNTDRLGCVTEYEYRDGLLRSESVEGKKTLYGYDADSNIVSVTDAEGRKVSLAYDAGGNMTEAQYPDGTKDTYEYDALSRLIKYTPRKGAALSYTYDCMSNVTEKAVGTQVTSYEYDLLGRNTAVITADGARTEAEYNAVGNVSSTTDALGNVTKYAYNETDQLTEITYADGSSVKAEYDLNGNLIKETDPEGGVKEYAYDALGRMTSVRDALGNVTAYEYDTNDNLIKVLDANGNETGYVYDANGNLLEETDAIGNKVSYTYTKEGLLSSKKDGEGNVTRFSYDRTGNLTETRYADGTTEKTEYTPLGQLSLITDESGTTAYLYDDGGRLLSVQEPSGEIVRYSYDEYGNITQIVYPDGKKASYQYDNMNRLIRVKGTDGAKTKYAYDALGQLISKDGKKTDTVYEYDCVGNLITVSTTGAVNIELSYEYDRTGRMVKETRTENDVKTENSYIYDALGQLTAWNDETYDYDAVGNMVSKNGTKLTYNKANQLISDGTDMYTYDGNGNLVQKGSTKYTYNALNLLESYTDGEYTESYAYNAQGLLKSITTPTETTSFVWDVLNGDGQILSSTVNGVTTDYTYGLERISAQTKGNRTEYVSDARGSVIAEVNSRFLSSDVSTKSYSPFGEQLNDNSTGFGYNGEYYNAATGMIYLRARFYAPEMNRFSQKDILRGSVTDALSLNRYLYCANDPVNFIDPSGMKNGAVKNFLKNTGNAIKNTVATAVSNTVQKISNGISSAVEKVKDIFTPKTNTTPPSSGVGVGAGVITGVGSNAGGGESWGGRQPDPTPQSYQLPKPDPYHFSASPTIEEIMEASNCGKTGNVYGVSVNKLGSKAKNKIDAKDIEIRALGAGDYGSGLTTESSLKALSAAEAIVGVLLIASGAGSAAGGILIAGSASSLLGGGMNGGSYEAGWLGGQVSGLITGTGLGVAGNAISTLGTATSLTASEAVSTVIESEVAAFIGGVVGGGIGDATAQFIDTQQINVEQSVQVGIINGTTSAIAAPISGIPSTISEVVKDTIGGITSAISSVVNEFVFDTSSAIVTSEGVQ